ncbi:unnamed protein product [Closterium sp. Yama58-4]|nr:unnamed protein product [Closterium sp. Yama58-4]
MYEYDGTGCVSKRCASAQQSANPKADTKRQHQVRLIQVAFCAMEIDCVHLCGLPGGLQETSWSVVGTRKEPPGVFIGASRVDDSTVMLSRQSDGASTFSVSSRTRLRAWPLGPPTHRFASPCVSDRASRHHYALLQRSADAPAAEAPGAGAPARAEAQVLASWPFGASSIAPSALLHKTGAADGCHVVEVDRPIVRLFPLTATGFADTVSAPLSAFSLILLYLPPSVPHPSLTPPDGTKPADQTTPGSSTTTAAATPTASANTSSIPSSPQSSGGVLALCADGSIRTYSPNLSLNFSLTEPADGPKIRVEASGSGSWLGHKGEGKQGSEWVLAVVGVEEGEGGSEGNSKSGRGGTARIARVYHVACAAGDAAMADVDVMARGDGHGDAPVVKVTLVKAFRVRGPRQEGGEEETEEEDEEGGEEAGPAVVSLCVGDAGEIMLLWSDATCQCFPNTIPPQTPSPDTSKDAVPPPTFLEASLTRSLAVAATRVVSGGGVTHHPNSKPSSAHARVTAAIMTAVPGTRYCLVLAAKPPSHTKPTVSATDNAASAHLPLYTIALDTLFGCVHACTPLPSSCSLPASVPPSPLPLPLIHAEWVGPSPEDASLLVTTPTALHSLHVHCPPLSLASVLGAFQPAVPLLLPTEPAAEPPSGAARTDSAKVRGVPAAGVVTAGWGGLAASAARAAGLALADKSGPGHSNPLQPTGWFVGPTLHDSGLVKNLPGKDVGKERQEEEELGGGSKPGVGQVKQKRKEKKKAKKSRGKARFGKLHMALNLSRATDGNGRQWLSFVGSEAEVALLNALEGMAVRDEEGVEGGKKVGSEGVENGEEREEGEEMEEDEVEEEKEEMEEDEEEEDGEEEDGEEEDGDEEDGDEEDGEEEEEEENEEGEEGEEGDEEAGEEKDAYERALEEADGMTGSNKMGRRRGRDPSLAEQHRLAHLILDCAKRLTEESGLTPPAAAAAMAALSPDHQPLAASVTECVRLFSPSVVSALTQHALARSHRMLLRAIVSSGQVTSALCPNLVPSLVARREVLLLEVCVVHMGDLPPRHLALILRLLLDDALAASEHAGEQQAGSDAEKGRSADEEEGVGGKGGGVQGGLGFVRSRVAELRRLRGRRAVADVRSVLAGADMRFKNSKKANHAGLQSSLAAALTSSAELDAFTDAELILHTVVAVPFDDTILAAALAPLSLPHVRFLFSYFAKWVDVYAARGFAVELFAYSVFGARPFLPVPRLERIFAWVSTLVDCHITRLLMLPDCLEPIARLHRRVMEQAAVDRRLTSVVGFVPHILAGLPLPEKHPNGFGNGGGDGIVGVEESGLTVQVVEL